MLVAVAVVGVEEERRKVVRQSVRDLSGVIRRGIAGGRGSR